MAKYVVHIHYKFEVEKYSMREAHKDAIEDFCNRDLDPIKDFKVKVTKTQDKYNEKM